MSSRKIFILLFGVASLLACNPALNWREVAWSQADIKAMLPCKPDHGSKSLRLAGQQIEMAMSGCEAQGKLFVIARVTLQEPNQLQAVQQAWQHAMLVNMQATQPNITEFKLKGASSWPVPVSLQAQGRSPQGADLQARAIWFAKGATLVHAVIYSDSISQEVAELFFSGIEIR